MPSLSMRVPPTSWRRAMTTSSLGWMRMTRGSLTVSPRQQGRRLFSATGRRPAAGSCSTLRSGAAPGFALQTQAGRLASAAARMWVASSTSWSRRRCSQGTTSSAGGWAGSSSSSTATSSETGGAALPLPPGPRQAARSRSASASADSIRASSARVVEPGERMANERQVGHQALAVVEQGGDPLTGRRTPLRLDPAALQRRAERGERVVGLAPRQALVDGVARAGAQRMRGVVEQVAHRAADRFRDAAPLPRRQHVAERPRQRRAEEGVGDALGEARSRRPGSTRCDCSSAITLAAVAVSPVALGDERVRRAERRPGRSCSANRRRQAREADDDQAAEHGAEDARVAPRQRLAQVAAQDDGDAQHQPVGMRAHGSASAR